MRAKLADPSANETQAELDDKAAASQSDMRVSARAVSTVEHFVIRNYSILRSCHEQELVLSVLL